MILFIKEPEHRSCFSLSNGFNSWPPCGIIQTSWSHSPGGARGHLTSYCYKASTHSPQLLRCSECSPYGGLCGARRSSPSWESLWPMNSLSHLSRVKCHIFGHCQNPRSGITHSLSNGISRRWSKQHVNIIYQIIFFDLVHFLNSDFKKYKTFSCTLKSLVGLLCI